MPTDTNDTYIYVTYGSVVSVMESSYVSTSYSPFMIFQLIIFTVVCQAIDVCGIGTNIINIICFIKQGFKDPVNVSLFGLAIADLVCLATLIWTNICMTPPFYTSDLPFEPMEFHHPTSCVLHTTFTRLSGWITALVTLERCLCITAPLKVKNIVTPKRVAIVVVCLFILLCASIAPVYVVIRLDWKYFPSLNKTLIGIIHTGDRENIEKVSYFINNVFIPFGSFIVIIICMIILVTKLHENAKWRMTSTISVQADTVSNRNQKVAKMVVMISIMFVVCFLPLSITFIGMALIPELSIGGKFQNELIIVAGIGFILESINSSVNIILYYNMSSKYRAAFRQLFKMRIDREKTSVVDFSTRNTESRTISSVISCNNSVQGQEH